MKNTNTVRTEIHYAQVGEYQLPLFTLPQTNDSEPLGIDFCNEVGGRLGFFCRLGQFIL